MASVTTVPREREELAPSVPDAAERAFEAARRVAQDWLDLTRLELESTLRRRLAAAAWLGGSVVLFAAAWIAAAVACAFALARVLDPDVSVACVALAHAALGGALLLRARRNFADDAREHFADDGGPA
jgi:hypothetical protein